MKTKSPVSMSFATGNGPDRYHKINFPSLFGTFSTILAVVAFVQEFTFREIDINRFGFPHPDNSTLHDSTVRGVNQNIKTKKSSQILNADHRGNQGQDPQHESVSGKNSPGGNYRGSVNQYNRQAIARCKDDCKTQLNLRVFS